MTKQIPYDLIPASDLPRSTPGAFDSVVGVDESTGAARRFPMPVTGAPKAYETRADLPASASEGTAAYVNNDPAPANNGLWAYLDGAWVQSADRVTGLEGRVGVAEVELDEHAEKLDRVGALRDPASEDIEQLADATGSVVRRTDAKGEVFVPGIEAGRSIQGALRDLGAVSSYGFGARPRDLLQFEDPEGKVLLRQSETGAFYLPGMAGSVQHVTGQSVVRTPYFRTSREDLHPQVKPLIADLAADGRPYIAPPSLLVPNNYHVPDGIVSAFSVEKTTDIWLDTPYGPGGLVHPHLIEMRVPFHGYRYLMVESPHRNGNAWEENAILYGTNDLQEFDLLRDVQQPLGYDPRRYGGQYNSDPVFTYDPKTGALIALWRAVGIPGSGNGYFYRSTWNGVDWTPEEYHVPDLAGTLSPSILYDPSADLWHLWTITPANLILHATGPSPYGPWTQVGTENPSAFKPWHMEVKWMGDKFMALVNEDQQHGNLYLGISDDGDNWTWGPALIDPPDPYPYKGSFVPEFDGDNLRLHVVWNTYAFPLPVGMTPTFHSESTNWVDLTDL